MRRGTQNEHKKTVKERRKQSVVAQTPQERKARKEEGVLGPAGADTDGSRSDRGGGVVSVGPAGVIHLAQAVCGVS